jgi:hypothetical protein
MLLSSTQGAPGDNNRHVRRVRQSWQYHDHFATASSYIASNKEAISGFQHAPSMQQGADCLGHRAERTQDARQFAPTEGRNTELMRSDLIFGALTHVNNRYKLCQLASKATRKLHKPNTRLQDTTNEVLDRFKDTVPMNLAPDAEFAEVMTERVAA